MSPLEQPVCFICEKRCEANSVGGEFDVVCSLCGKYRISRIAFNKPKYFNGDRHFMMCAIRKMSAEGKHISFHEGLENELRSLVFPPQNPIESIDLILKFVAGNTGPGRVVDIDLSKDFPLFFAVDACELDFHVKNAKELGYLSGHDDMSASCTIALTLKGWQRLDEIKRYSRDSKRGFVAMWFDASMDAAWEQGVKPALEKTGFIPVRIDAKEHNNKICDEIVAEIRKSGLLIADFTGHRNGVYFEVGLAMGLGIPVVWTCRAGDIEKAHFDTRQYNHIVWENPEDLKEKLVNRIDATILT
jgi:nucleoside 2-deoxyribosyltransferase